MTKFSTILPLLSFMSLCACSPGFFDLGPSTTGDPTLSTVTRIGGGLNDLAPPSRRVDLAVYSYDDQTGQQKPDANITRFSKAVTQGAEAILIDVLKDVSDGKWFNVVERVGIQNLLTERQLIDQANQAYTENETSPLPPLRFAGLILEGGIVNYDSNTRTGGVGARYLGVGGSTQYRQDIVTVALRAVSVKSGEVLTSVTTEKTVYSTLLDASVFKYVAVDELLEIEAGTSSNEPVGLAVRQAIELAVYSLIIEGADDGLWSFRDRNEQRRLIATYKAGAVIPLKREDPVVQPAVTTVGG